MSSHIQSIMFDKYQYTTTEARKWLKRNGYVPIKRVDETKNYYRYRLLKPFKTGRYRIIDFNRDIKAVVYFPET